jgi:hypothetical protein
VAVDLALVTDVLPDGDNARDLGVFTIADALPFSVAPATAPAVLAIGSGSYGVLSVVAGVCAVAAAVAVLPVKRVRRARPLVLPGHGPTGRRGRRLAGGGRGAAAAGRVPRPGGPLLDGC